MGSPDLPELKHNKSVNPDDSHKSPREAGLGGSDNPNPLRTQFINGKDQVTPILPNSMIGLLALEVIGAVPSVPKGGERPLPKITKGADGTVKVAGEAEIKNFADGRVNLKRTEAGTNIEIQHTKDGGISYRHTGDNKTDNYDCTIRPDGKGGSHISWQRDKEKVEYHWSPKKATEQAIPSGQHKISATDQQTDIFKSTIVNAIPAPVEVETDPGKFVCNNGKDAKVYRQDLSVTDTVGITTLDVRFSLVTSDTQHNRITIRDNGSISIENAQKHSAFSFVPEEDGYKIQSIGLTNDNIASRSLRNGVEKTLWNNGVITIKDPDGTKKTIKTDYDATITTVTVIEKSDGSKTTIRESSDNTDKTTTENWYSDGTYKIAKSTPDGHLSAKTYFPDYPKGAFLYTESSIDEHYSSVRDDGDNPKAREEVRKLALKEQTDLKSKYDVGISADETVNNGSIILRYPTLKETRLLDEVLNQFPVDKEENMYFAFVNQKSVQGKEDAGAFYAGDGQIIVNPSSGDNEEWFQEANPDIAHAVQTSQSFKFLLGHELGHHLDYRRDPKAFQSGFANLALAEKYNFKTIEKIGQDHQRQFVVRGKEIDANGTEHDFFYALGKEDCLRFNLSGQIVNREGKVIDKPDPEEEISIMDVANTKFPTQYSYKYPYEASAERYTLFSTNEKTAAYLLAFDKKNGTHHYAQARAEDQLEIDRHPPLGKKSATGFMRIPSGKIVARTAENEQLVVAFEHKYK